MTLKGQSAGQLPSRDAMVASILSAYGRATEDQRDSGRRWYVMAGHMTRTIAAEFGRDPRTVAVVISALSPRNPWRWNVADAYNFVAASRDGRPMPSATTFHRNSRHAWAALQSDTEGVAPWVSEAPKVRSFVNAITGDLTAVVVDAWALRVATDGQLDYVGRRDEAYRRVAEAYTLAAEAAGEHARDMQAITWLVAQTEGLGSNRRGRHDLSFKAGTPQVVRDLLPLEG